MNRTILTVGLVAALFLGVALVFVWYVSFGMGRPSTGEIEISSIDEPAILSYHKDGSVSVSASSELDAYRALGYQAGRDHGWTIALLRQTASGRLSEWFGAPVLQIDKFARLLGFASSAREAASGLDPDDARALAAYADGVSDALRDEDVSMGNEFVVFDIRPEPWEPWHSLAIERMIAWLADPPIVASTEDSLFWPIRSLEDNDRRFRSWLHLHGADMSAAWSWTDSTGSQFAARFVYGASALPLFSAVSLKWPQTSVAGIALLGTPFLPVISGPGGVCVTTFSSNRRIEPFVVARNNDLLQSRHERIIDDRGDEVLLSVATYENSILIDREGTRPESDSIFQAVALTWPGLGPITDWASWRQAVQTFGSTDNTTDNTPDNPKTLRLIDGDGFSITERGVTVTGSPEVQVSFKDRLFVSNNIAVSYPARRFASMDASPQFPLSQDVSEWARINAPRALSLMEPAVDYPENVEEAIEYLRNWDYQYNISSIGASIFDSWMLHYREIPGTYPEILVPEDSLGYAQTRAALRLALIAAVDSLTMRAGPDLARWRLEYLRRGKRFFPVWSYPPLEDELPGLIRSRYDPIEIHQDGHPTTLTWQPGLDDEPANSPAHVVVRGIVGLPESVTVQPDYDIGSGFIARYVAGPPRPRGRDADQIVDEVVLIPEN